MALIPILYPLINGVRYQFASIELKLNGQIYLGCKSINYSRIRTRGWARGTSPDPLAKTRGTNEYKCDVELYLAEHAALVDALALQGALTGGGFGDVFFTVDVFYGESAFSTLHDTIIGCTLDSNDSSNSEGSDALTRKSELNPVKILWNGNDDLGPTGLLTPPIGF